MHIVDPSHKHVGLTAPQSTRLERVSVAYRNWLKRHLSRPPTQKQNLIEANPCLVELAPKWSNPPHDLAEHAQQLVPHQFGGPRRGLEQHLPC